MKERPSWVTEGDNWEEIINRQTFHVHADPEGSQFYAITPDKETISAPTYGALQEEMSKKAAKKIFALEIRNQHLEHIDSIQNLTFFELMKELQVYQSNPYYVAFVYPEKSEDKSLMAVVTFNTQTFYENNVGFTLINSCEREQFADLLGEWEME